MTLAAIISSCIGCGIACRYIAASFAMLGRNILSIVRAV